MAMHPAVPVAAATIAAELLRLMPAGAEVTTQAITSAYLQALEAIEDAHDACASGNWRAAPARPSFYEGDPTP